MRIFLICPVRGICIEGDDSKRIANYVESLERDGNTVYWPLRDTDQSDSVGLRICASNRAAIESADVVHVWFDPSSEGSRFDLGMAFMARKPIVLANEVQPTAYKSFQNVLLELSKQ